MTTWQALGTVWHIFFFCFQLLVKRSIATGDRQGDNSVREMYGDLGGTCAAKYCTCGQVSSTTVHEECIGVALYCK